MPEIVDRLKKLIAANGGSTVGIRDIDKAVKRLEEISPLGPKNATKWIGVTTTPLTDGASTNPIVINSETYTAENGDIASYDNDEFIFNGSVWQELGGPSRATEVTISDGGSITQALDAGKLYHFTGALTALNITLNAAPAGQLSNYHFDFLCGSTPPTVSLPNTVKLPDGNSVDANTRYEVDILNNYGTVASWSLS